MPGSLGIQMLKLSLCMKISIKSNIRQRNNLCYFSLKCSRHQETDLFEKSKHLLEHTSPVSYSRLRFGKLHKYQQQGLFLLQVMELRALPGPALHSPHGALLQGALLAQEQLQGSLRPELASDLHPLIQITQRTHSGADQGQQNSGCFKFGVKPHSHL